MTLIQVKNRVKQLDDAREIALPTISPTAFTTAGELTLTGEQEEEKLAKQAAARRLAEILKIVDGIRGIINDRLEILIRQICPMSVQEMGEPAVAKWMQEEGFHIFRKELTYHVHMRDKPIAEIPIFIAPEWRWSVVNMMAEEEHRANNGNGN